MPNPLQQQLETALSGSYTIERELGGGGMSHVYVATDSSLGRRVVVKVLPPDLGAALSAERFNREIRLMANLQHPHIVPVLTAGRAGELLYYTMPLVQGQSLRARIKSGGPLPVPDAERIIREVLRALAHAHKHGIVHRDIKPDNILLSDDGALVTDFGIAKAMLSAAESKTGEQGRGGLTGVGMTVGTLNYMAPEQMSGDPAADHRVDLYAVGLVLYESLTGELPFASESPHQRLTSMVTEKPERLSVKRADVPPALSKLVARCLKPDPAERPASAQVALEMLDAAATGRRAPRKTLGTRMAIAAGIAASLIVVGGWAVNGPLRVPLATAQRIITRPDATLRTNRILVAPFAATPDEPSLRDLGAMIADYVAQGLSVVPRVEVVDPRTAMLNAEVVERIPRLLRKGDRAVALAEETGARVVLTGHLYRDGDSLRADAVILDAATGSIRQSLGATTVAAGQTTALIDAIRKRAVAAVTAATDSTLPVDFGQLSTPPSLEGYALMRQGLRQIIANDSSALATLRRAAAMDTGWVMPRLLLARAAVNVFMYPLADSTLASVAARLDRATPAERSLYATEEAGLRADKERFHAAAEELLRTAPGSTEAQLLAAVGALTVRLPRRALEITNQIDPNRGIHLASPFYPRYRSIAFLRLGDFKSAAEIAREGAERFGYGSFGAFVVRAHAGARDERIREVIDAAARRTDHPVLSRALFAEQAALQLLRAGGKSTAQAIAREALADRDLIAASRTSRAIALRRLALASVTGDTTALGAVQAMLGPNPGNDTSVVRLMGLVAAMRGDTAGVARVDSLLSRVTNKYDYGWTPYLRARMAALLGDRDRAVRLLGEADAKGYPHGNVEGFAPEIDAFLISLHGFEPFERLIAKR